MDITKVVDEKSQGVRLSLFLITNVLLNSLIDKRALVVSSS